MVASVEAIIKSAKLYATEGMLPELKELRKNKLFPEEQSILTSAAVRGHIDILQWWFEEKLFFNLDINAVISEGKLDVIKWLNAKGLLKFFLYMKYTWIDDSDRDQYQYQYGVNRHYPIHLSNAAENGHLDIIKYFVMELGWYNLYSDHERNNFFDGYEDISKLSKQLSSCLVTAIKNKKYHIYEWIKDNFGFVLGLHEIVNFGNLMYFSPEQVKYILKFQDLGPNSTYFEIKNLDQLDTFIFVAKYIQEKYPNQADDNKRKKISVCFGEKITEEEIIGMIKLFDENKISFKIPNYILFSKRFFSEKFVAEMKIKFSIEWEEYCKTSNKKLFSDEEEEDTAVTDLELKLDLKRLKDVLKRLNKPKEQIELIGSIGYQLEIDEEDDSDAECYTLIRHFADALTRIDSVDYRANKESYEKIILEIIQHPRLCDKNKIFRRSIYFEGCWVDVKVLKFLMTNGIPRDQIRLLGEINDRDKNYLHSRLWKDSVEDFDWVVENKFWELNEDSIYDIIINLHSSASTFDPLKEGLELVKNKFSTLLCKIMPAIVVKLVKEYLRFQTNTNTSSPDKIIIVYQALIWIKENFHTSFPRNQTKKYFDQAKKMIEDHIQENCHYSYREREQKFIAYQIDSFIITNNCDDPDLSCFVCQDEIINGETVSKTKCSHIYHEECMNTLLEYNLEKKCYQIPCPACRTPIESKMIDSHPMLGFLDELFV